MSRKEETGLDILTHNQEDSIARKIKEAMEEAGIGVHSVGVKVMGKVTGVNMPKVYVVPHFSRKSSDMEPIIALDIVKGVMEAKRVDVGSLADAKIINKYAENDHGVVYRVWE